MSKEFPVQHVLELACAAQRVNGEYLKDLKWFYDDDDRPLYRKESNKSLMLYTLGKYEILVDQYRPDVLEISQEDKDMATAVRSHFRKLMFSAVKGDNDFNTSINTLLNSEMIEVKQFGYIACLPSVYIRDLASTKVKRQLKDCDNEPLSNVSSVLVDKDCEIVEVKYSKNFDTWNICAIIDNKIVSWFSKNPLKVGACVLQKGKVKEHRQNWNTNLVETRLNYVKAAQ